MKIKIKTILYLFILNILSLSGCAINDLGSSKITSYENQSVYSITIESWGLIINTISSDYGFYIGKLKRTYLYPKTTTQKIINYSYNGLKKFILYPVQPINLSELYAVTPFVIKKHIQGVGFDVNNLRVGLIIGELLSNVLKIPNDFLGVFYYKSNPNLNKEMVYIDIGE